MCTTITICPGIALQARNLEYCGKALKDVDDKTYTSTASTGDTIVTCTNHTSCGL